ncbi:MAG: efflux RND transporter periplasmic adaptor subunit [Pseudomonadales bacterium]|nr:efflux RND transporter periplasmic adaptor subunit [Pseudomonadales bacterium]
MKLPFQQIVMAMGIVCLLIILAYAWHKTDEKHEHGSGGYHTEASDEKIEKGAHGGRLFKKDNFALEVKIFEQGVEPQLRLYAFDNNKTIAPQNLQAQVVINRLDATQTLDFRPEADYLLGNAVVYEPHSFVMQINASYAGKNYVFEWQQLEGRLTLSSASLASNGIELHTVSPKAMADNLSLQGEIQVLPERNVAILVRVAGEIVSINKPLGAQVKQGEVLLVLESRELATLRANVQTAQQRLMLAQEHFHHQSTLFEQKMSSEHDYMGAKTQLAEAEISLNEAKKLLNILGAKTTGGARLAIRAPMNGVVIDNKLAVGQVVSVDMPLMRIADLSTLMAVVNVPASNVNEVRVGMAAEVILNQMSTQGKVSYLGAVLNEDTRSAQAFVRFDNPSQSWKAGQLVHVNIIKEMTTVPMAIREDAVQIFRDWQVVFIRVGEQFEVRPLELGRHSQGYIEVLNGLSPNQVYGAGNSFLLKAELGKSGASHDH